METTEARLARDRVRNASRGVLSGKVTSETALVGTQGAVAYAILDLANAIRSLREDKSSLALRMADLLADAIADGMDMEKVKDLAEQFKIERQGFTIDQRSGLQFLKGMVE